MYGCLRNTQVLNNGEELFLYFYARYMIRAIVTMPKKMMSMINGDNNDNAYIDKNDDNHDDGDDDDDDDDDDDVCAHAGLQASMSRKCGVR